MAADNVFECVMALDLCVEVVSTNLIFVGIPSVGALNGGTALAQEMLTTQSDETRHMAIGQSTVRTLLRDERNLPQIQYWLDKWFRLHHRAIAGPTPLIPDYFASASTSRSRRCTSATSSTTSSRAWSKTSPSSA